MARHLRILESMKFISQIVTAASGSIRGCVFSRNRSGAYIRGRVVPVNPGSAFQNVVRAALATLVARWTSVLTVAQRTAWDTWAFNTPHTDSLGQSITITGQNAYISLNALRIQFGVAVIDTAPIIFAGAVLTPPGIVSATAATEVLSISFTNTDLWATAVGGYLAVYVSRPQNASVLFFKGPYRLMGKISGAVVPPTSPMPITSTFPFEVGQRVHTQFRAVNADGRIASAQRQSIIAV